MRETTTFKLPCGDEVVINSYVTYGEKTQLNSIYFKEAGDLTDAERQSGLKATIFKQVNDLALKLVLVSINGKKDGDVVEGDKPFSIVDYINALRMEDGVALFEKINEVIGGKKTL